MIRLAKENEFDEILMLAAEFWEQTEYDEEFDPDQAALMIRLCFDSGLLVVLDVGGVVGFVAGVQAPLLGNKSTMMATELAYYISPSHRGAGVNLLRFYENQARSLGVKYNVMVSLQSSSPEIANKIYEKMGYHLTEMSYVKVL